MLVELTFTLEIVIVKEAEVKSFQLAYTFSSFSLSLSFMGRHCGFCFSIWLGLMCPSLIHPGLSYLLLLHPWTSFSVFLSFGLAVSSKWPSVLRSHCLFVVRDHTTAVSLGPTFRDPVCTYFEPGPSLVTPSSYLKILISATSNLVSCLFVSAIVSKPYIMPDRTAMRWSFPFNLADACLSHSSPVIFPRQPRQRCHVSLIPSILSWSVKWPKRYAMLWRKIRQWKSEKRGS